MAFAIMAASPMHAMPAAETAGPVTAGVPAGAAAPAVRTTFVVRADPRTGRLVRSAVVHTEPAPRPGLSKAGTKPPKEISDLVDQASRTHQVDPLLVHSIIKVESNYNSFAVSNKGAEGLMQLMPPTARMLGVSNSFDPQQNIEAGVKYLKYLQGVYKDDRLALAAYNAGPAAVDKYKQVPPFKETQNYVEQVGRRYDDARRAAVGQTADQADHLDHADLGDQRDKAGRNDPEKAAAPAAASSPEQAMVEKHRKLEQFVDANGRLSFRTVE
jgi:soluble lytic murein transglycosylase-like protein